MSKLLLIVLTAMAAIGAVVAMQVGQVWVSVFLAVLGVCLGMAALSRPKYEEDIWP